MRSSTSSRANRSQAGFGAGSNARPFLFCTRENRLAAGLFISLLQNQAAQFGLSRDAGFVEDPGQVTACRSHSDAEPIGGGFPAVALDNLERERCFSRGEAK